MDWQQIIALAIVVAAFFWLVRRAFARGGTAGCGGCAGCAGTPPREKPRALVQLDVSPSHRNEPIVVRGRSSSPGGEQARGEQKHGE